MLCLSSAKSHFPKENQSTWTFLTGKRKDKQSREARRSQSETALFQIILAQPQAPVFDSSQRWNVRYLSQICSDLMWPFWCFIPVFWQHKVPSQTKEKSHGSRQPLVYFESHRVDCCDVCDTHSPALSKACLGKSLGIALWLLWLWLCSETQKNFLASTSESISHVRTGYASGQLFINCLLITKTKHTERKRSEIQL